MPVFFLSENDDSMRMIRTSIGLLRKTTYILLGAFTQFEYTVE